MKAILYKQDGTTKEIIPIINEKENKTIVRIPKYTLMDEKIEYIDLDTGYFEAQAGEEGYFLSSGSIAHNTSLLYFTEREDFSTRDNVKEHPGLNVMPVMGIRKNGNAVFMIVTGMYMDFCAHYEVKDNQYKMTAHFVLDGDDPYEDILLELYKIPNGTYNEMAHIYRDYQIKTKGLKPIKERIKEKPALAYAAESVEVRIRQGWKPAPSPVAHQNAENEPPMKVVCDFARVEDIMREMKKQGVEKAEICLVGWNRGGHDGRFPQLFPPEPLLGGDAGLKKLIATADELGYQIVCHDNYTAAYECAECWDEEYVAKFKDGRLASKHYDLDPLSGGMPYIMCAQRAYERFARNRLPKYREVGFHGLHFVDVFSAVGPRKCYDYRHPATYADCRDYFLKIMNLASKNIGGFQSEGPFDYIVQELDSVMYSTMKFRGIVDKEKFPQVDEMVPFWQIVYHGYVLSNPSSDTINYTIKEKDRELYFMELGGRPLMYFYSRFVNDGVGKLSNWMGLNDLRCDDDEQLAESVKAVKKAYDNIKTYSYLQYETIEHHEKLSENVFQTTYSDGTVVTVDYSTNNYTVEKEKK